MWLRPLDRNRERQYGNPMRQTQRKALAAGLLACLLLPECGGTSVEVSPTRDPRCRGHFNPYPPTEATGMPEAPIACFDQATGRCMQAVPEGCDHPFPGDLEDCQIVCEDRGCNAAEPCSSSADACVLLTDKGTGLCVPRCKSGSCPAGQVSSLDGPDLHTCAPAEPDYSGSCSGSCVVCGLSGPFSIRVAPANAKATVIAGSSPPSLNFKAFFSREGDPEIDVSASASWSLEDASLGHFSSPGTLQLSGVAGKTAVFVQYGPPDRPKLFTSGAWLTIDVASSN
jgi:hypothetical protein